MATDARQTCHFRLGGTVFRSSRLMLISPIFLAGDEIALDFFDPLQFGSAMELNASRNFSPHNS